MADITSPEAVGIGIVAVTFGSFIFKMWTQQNKNYEKMTDALVRNAETHQQLSNTITNFDGTLKENTAMLRANTEVTQVTKDKFSEILVSLARKRK